MPKPQPCKEELQTITLNPQPIKLEVETPTDWPAIASTSLVAFAVGLMAYLGQRSQVRAAKANFRNEWQKELKELTARFISIISKIHYETESKTDFIERRDSNEIFSTLIETQAKIILMLDKKKPYTKAISDSTEQLIKAVKNKSIDDLNRLSRDLLDTANSIIEQTWKDIQRDIEGKKQRTR